MRTYMHVLARAHAHACTCGVGIPRRVARLLHVHPKVDDVGEDLGVALRLDVATHDAK